MLSSVYIGLVIGLLVLIVFWCRRTNAIEKAVRERTNIRAVMSAFRVGDYAGGLQASEKLMDGPKRTREYCMFRGFMLHQLGRLSEAESCFREALPLHSDPRQRALSLNSLATVFMDQERFTEAAEFYEDASRVWPDRGASLRGIAEVWLRQGRELAGALAQARHAVAIDRRATGMSKEALSGRLGEDLAVLAWALAVNIRSQNEVEDALDEAFRLCDKSPVSTLAQLHYHAGLAYQALSNVEKSSSHFQQAAQVDPNGRFGRLAASTFS